jgi:hypothetical protein
MRIFVLCALKNIIKVITSGRMRFAGRVRRMVEMKNSYRILVGKSEGKRPVGKPKCR